MDNTAIESCTSTEGQLERIRNRLESQINVAADIAAHAATIADQTLGVAVRQEDDVPSQPPADGRVNEIFDRLDTLEIWLSRLAREISHLKEL